jgi:hypothetical protein
LRVAGNGAQVRKISRIRQGVEHDDPIASVLT